MLEPGTIVGDYESIRTLGSGSFGTVYLAKDADGGLVSLKVARAPSSAAFRAQRDTTAKVDHPGVVPVIDFFESEEFGSVLVSEYVDGQSLAEPMTTIPPVGAVKVASRLAATLCTAHSKGIIHRDLKPSNVIIPVQSDQPVWHEARLTDFGVAGTIEPLLGTTISGEVFGTPEYMSPEQLLGKAQTPSTDVFGLGLLFYEMLLNKKARHGPASEVLWDVRRGTVHYPETMPKQTKRVLLKLLAPEPTERPSDACEALVLINSLSESDTSAPTGSWKATPDKGAKPAPLSNRRWLVAAAIACMFGLPIFLGRSYNIIPNVRNSSFRILHGEFYLLESESGLVCW